MHNMLQNAANLYAFIGTLIEVYAPSSVNALSLTVGVFFNVRDLSTQQAEFWPKIT